ncbi:MAG: 5-bromo-4-chloroindolyl phosphate hydrolysis family protein [Pseudomonadota bacterium]
MALAETPRQILAGLAASATFLGTFFGLHLVWWLALAFGLAVFAAFLLIVPRKKGLEEIDIGDGINAAELKAGIEALTEAAARMRKLALSATGDDKAEFSRMAKLFEAIRSHHSDDPKDFKHTRRFIRHDLPRLVDTAERYMQLGRKASGTNRDRVAALGSQIRGFVPVLEKIDQACLENDFLALEVEVDVLSGQLDRR